jgi:glutamate-1-semialdehyde aminotransferase
MKKITDVYQLDAGKESRFPPNSLKDKILECVGMEGEVIVSIGKESALQNALKVISRVTEKGVGYFEGCYYGENTCVASQLSSGGFDCDNFEILPLSGRVELESNLENYKALIGGVIIQPFKVTTDFLQVLRAVCNEYSIFLVDDETNIVSDSLKNIPIDVDILMLGSYLVSDVLPVEVVVVKKDVELPIRQYPLNPVLYEMMEDVL